jgi:IS1 family transposase
MDDMNKLNHDQRCAVIRCLCEGCSIRSTVRITGVAKNTIQKLTKEVGEACLAYSDKVFRNLIVERAQVDEIWCFCYAKEKNLPDHLRDDPTVGSMWTWTAMDAQTKLIFSWRLGSRDASVGQVFMDDVAARVNNKLQLTTDGHAVYLNAVTNSFGYAVDYAQLVKLYGTPSKDEAIRYSPAKCLGARKEPLIGDPDKDHISTSFAERQNLNIRMQNRRFTRLTNAFSKKAEMLAYSVAITFFYHNFARKHQTLRMPPALKHGVATHVWSISDMVKLADEAELDRKAS